MKAFDFIGKKFNNLLVIKRIKNSKSGHSKWECLCDCGNKKTVKTTGDNLKRNRVKSCINCRFKRTQETRKKNILENPERYKRKVSYVDWSLYRKSSFESAIKLLYGNYKRTSKRYFRDFTLNFNFFKQLVTSNCYYCGSKPSREFRTGKYDQYTWLVGGVDRIDSSLGYIETNVLSCCEPCNRMKLYYNQDFFIQHVNKIVKNINSLNNQG